MAGAGMSDFSDIELEDMGRQINAMMRYYAGAGPRPEGMVGPELEPKNMEHIDGGKVKQIAEKVVPVWEYIADEAKSHGWSAYDLARRMNGHTETNYEALKLLADSPNIALGQTMADLLADVFGTSAEFWLDVDRQYQEAVANG